MKQFDEIGFKRIKELAKGIRNTELIERLEALEDSLTHNFSFEYQKQMRESK
jgi:hypothetical protein